MYRKTVNHEQTSELVFKALELLKEIDENYFKDYISLSITLAPPYQLAENANYFNSHKLLSELKLLVNTVNDQDSDFFDSIDIKKKDRSYRMIILYWPKNLLKWTDLENHFIRLYLLMQC